jgi:branched-chain amino acid transport system substrate-binding protein
LKHTPKQRLIVSALVTAATVLLLAACGSTKTNGSASVAATSNVKAAPASASADPSGAGSIRVGFVCSCSGAQSAEVGSSRQVGTAWADSVNASGGINGHPVKLFVEDDAGNPATGLQDVKALVTEDHVVAIIDMSLADSAWASYIASRGIPVTGGISVEAPMLTNPDFYPSGTQLLVLTVGNFALAKAAGKTDIGVMYCAESPVCAQLVPLAQGAGATTGVKVSSEKVSATAPSYVADCLSLRNAGVDAMFPAVAAPVVLRVTDQCAQQGYKPLLTSQTTTAANSWLADKNLDGAILSSTNANQFDTSTPSVEAFHQALNKYAPGLASSSAFNYLDGAAWAGGQLLKAAATAAKLTPTSAPADLKKGLYALKNETLGGFAPPLNYRPGKPAFIPCYFTAKVQGSRFESLSADKPTCLTTVQTDAMVKAFHLG